MTDIDFSPLWISLKTALFATIFSFVFGIIVAGFMFSYRGKFKNLIDGILSLPIVLPPTVVGFLLLLLLGKNGVLGKLLMKFDFNVIFSWEATVITATVVAFPLMYKSVLSSFKQVDNNLINVAKTLGASKIRIFTEILLPLAWQGIITGTILAMLRALGEFGATLMLAGNIPGKTQTIAMAIFFAGEAGKMDQALIWVMIMIGISFCLITIINYISDAQYLTQGKIFNNIFSFINSHFFKIFTVKNISEKPRTTENQQLSVNVEKDLNKFKLNIQFNSEEKVLGIIGASGSGKSMTLRCIAGLETPTKGHIILNGKVLFDSAQKINIPSRKRNLGIVFQNYALFPHKTVLENISFGLQKIPQKQAKQIVNKYLELMELQGLEKRYPHELSGGQKQRVALARALAINPEVILLDEPLSALDNYLRSKIEQLLIDVFSQYSGIVLFVTHKLEEVYRVCDNLLVLSEGKIIASGKKQDIFEHPPNFITAQITECKNFSRARKIDDETIEALDWNCHLKVVESIPNSLTYVGIRAHHLTFTENPNLENTFPCFLVKKSETQHRVTVFLRLNQDQTNTDTYDYHLQGEIYKEKWEKLKTYPSPWYIYLNPLRLILIQ